MKRKIIQIIIREIPDEKHSATLYALCDDGTIWMSYPEVSNHDEWFQLDTSNLEERKTE